MHGLIHAELERFVETSYGAEAWKTVLNEAGLGEKVYLPGLTYADHEAAAIVSATSQFTNTPAAELLERFGQFLAPTLINIYEHLIQPGWKTMDLLLHTEETIHKVVRQRKFGPQPPRLQFEQTGPNTLNFNYDSPRQMSALGKGIIRGVAKHYGEKVEIEERKGAGGSVEMKITIS